MYDSKTLNLKLNPRNVPTTLALSLTLIGLLLWTTHSASYNPLGLGFWDPSGRGMDVDYSDIRVGVYEGSGFHDGTSLDEESLTLDTARCDMAVLYRCRIARQWKHSSGFP